MAHDDFLRVAAKPKRLPNKMRPANGVRGIAIRLPDGTCGLLNFDTGALDVWNVGGLPKDWATSGFSVERVGCAERWRDL